MLRTAALLAAVLAFACAQESRMVMKELAAVDTITTASAGDAFAAAGRFVDVGIGFSQLYPGMNMWVDLPTAKWQHVPAWLWGVPAIVPSSLTSAGKKIEWQCAPQKYTGEPYCDAYVFMYNCVGCAFKDGDLAAALVADDWEPFRCAPTVEVTPGGVGHKMLAFHKRVPEGTTEEIFFGEETGLTTFAFDRSGKDCKDTAVFPDEAACTDASHKHQCAWKDGGCELNRCLPVGPIVPSPICSTHCLPDEIAALP